MKSQAFPHEISYFQILLRNYLQDSHPERVNDTEFITNRSDLAEDSYEKEIRSGHNQAEAMDIAKGVLFQDLHFSKFSTIKEVLEEEFPDLLLVQKEQLSLKMLSVCEEVFCDYELDDNFCYSEQFDELYTELTGAIQIYIDNHVI